MKWLLVFLPFWVKGQCLKPGTYHNLKPTEPLVLDTGTYTFIQLEMKDLNSGTWLDARKAWKVDLHHCSFEGKSEGTAVLSSGDVTVSHCRIMNMKEGIVQASPPGSVRKVCITNNVFTDNGTAIRLEVEKDYCSGMIKSSFVSVREDTNRGGAGKSLTQSH